MSSLLLLLLAASPAHRDWTLDTGPKAKVDVSSLHGRVTVYGADRPDVAIAADWTPNSGWSVEVEHHGDQVEVRACCGRCERSSRQSCDGEVSLSIQVPQRAKLSVSAVDVATRVDAVRGEVDVSTVSGKVSVRGTEGSLEVNSVSGDIELAPSRVGPTEVNSVSGDVRMTLPDSADAEISFSTLSGHRKGPSRVGRGDQKIDVSTLSGDVEVEKT